MNDAFGAPLMGLSVDPFSVAVPTVSYNLAPAAPAESSFLSSIGSAFSGVDWGNLLVGASNFGRAYADVEVSKSQMRAAQSVAAAQTAAVNLAQVQQTAKQRNWAIYIAGGAAVLAVLYFVRRRG